MKWKLNIHNLFQKSEVLQNGEEKERDWDRGGGRSRGRMESEKFVLKVFGDAALPFLHTSDGVNDLSDLYR